MHLAVVRVGAMVRLVILGGVGLKAEAQLILPLEGAVVVQRVLVDTAQIHAVQALAMVVRRLPAEGATGALMPPALSQSRWWTFTGWMWCLGWWCCSSGSQYRCCSSY